LITKTQDIHLRLFGTPQCTIESATFFPAKAYALLTALLLAPGGFMTRQAAATLLWDGVSQAKAFGNLRQLLRRLLQIGSGDDALVVVTDTMVHAGPGTLKSDLSLFLAACHAQDIETQLSGLLMMRGELLDGLETGQDDFYLWLLSERARVKNQFFTLAASVLHEVTRFGKWKQNDIAALADCILDLEPEREESYRLLIEAHGRCGDFAASERVYQSLLQMLAADDNRRPEPATIAVYRRVQGAMPARAEASAAVPPPASQRKPRVAFLAPVRADGEAVTVLTRAFVEDVANSLVRFRTFAVIAPHSSFAFGGEIPGGTQVDYRVQSTLLGTTMSFSLLDCKTYEILWSSEFPFEESQFNLLFRVLSKHVASVLAEQIEWHQIEPSRQFGSDAYRHLLSGQSLLQKCDLPMLRRARGEFRKAADLDTGLAAARARVAQTLQLEWLMLGGGDPFLLQRAKAEAEAAIQADPASGTGHWMAAVVALYQRDYEGSARKFYEAESLSPNSADLLLQHADALAHFGEPVAAWERFEHAIELNPLAPDIYWWAGASIAFDLQDYGKAVELCGRMENDEPALRVLTASHALNGDLDNARLCAVRLMETYPGITAREIVKLSPDKNSAANENFYHGLKLAGLI
jgi:DNA-binding SARP family transcriptional activator/Tfp pilus assembly protein PilF